MGRERFRRPTIIDHRGEEDASHFDTMAAKAWSCCCGSSTSVIDRRTRSLIVGPPDGAACHPESPAKSGESCYVPSSTAAGHARGPGGPGSSLSPTPGPCRSLRCRGPTREDPGAYALGVDSSSVRRAPAPAEYHPGRRLYLLSAVFPSSPRRGGVQRRCCRRCRSALNGLWSPQSSISSRPTPAILPVLLIRLSDVSGTDRHGPVEEAGPAPAARRIGNGFPPPPVFLHEPGRFEGTQADTSRLGGCRQTLDVERVRPQTMRRQLVTETRSNGSTPPPPPLNPNKAV